MAFLLKSQNYSTVVQKEGCRGCKRTEKCSDLVKIQANYLKIPVKSMEIWVNYLKTFAKSLKIWKKLAPKVVSFEKMAPSVCRITWKPFFGGHPRRRPAWENEHRKSSPKFLGQVWGNAEKNTSRPQKFACFCTYATLYIFHGFEFIKF